MDITNDKAVPLTKQLINDYEETHASTIAVMPVPHEEVLLMVSSPLKAKVKMDVIALKLSLKNQIQKMHQVILLSSDVTF